MHARKSSVALFATLLVGVAVACSSDPASSTVDPNPQAAAGMRSSSGGSGPTANKAGSPGSVTTAGATSNPAGTSGSSSGSVPGEACKGLPIDLSGDAQGGAPSV